MGPFDRVLLAGYTCFLTVVFLIFSAVMVGWTSPVLLFRDFLNFDRPDVLWAIIIVLLLAGVRLFWVSVRKTKGRHVVLTERDLGQIKLSLQAIENLIEKVVSQINGVKEIKSNIFSVPQGIGIQIRASVTPEVNVPEVSAEIQERVKERVFEVTGLSVGTVKVLIENITVKKPRVE